MIESLFPELLQKVVCKIEITTDQTNEIGEPVIEKKEFNINAVVDSSTVKNYLGYNGDNILYTSDESIKEYSEKIKKDNIKFIIKNKEFIVIKLNDYYEYLEFILVEKNV